MFQVSLDVLVLSWSHTICKSERFLLLLPGLPLFSLRMRFSKGSMIELRGKPGRTHLHMLFDCLIRGRSLNSATVCLDLLILGPYINASTSAECFCFLLFCFPSSFCQERLAHYSKELQQNSLKKNPQLKTNQAKSKAENSS